MRRLTLAVVVVLISGCGQSSAAVEGPASVETHSGSRLTYEAFKARHARYDADRAAWIADGHLPFFSEKALREFYELNVQEGQLIVNRVGSADDIWDAQRRRNLTYCVSNDFGARKATVVSAMQEAAQGWMAVANLAFSYVPAQDASCTRTNAAVLFNVRPIDANGAYLASAFFPSNGRSSRELVIDASLFGGGVSVTGVLRHELGHVLGFRHEHTRPQAGTCFEDNNWRAVTSYDSASVMHYPQCNGTNTWNLPLTALDIEGVQALYGPPVTTPAPTPAPPPAPATTTRQLNDAVAANGTRAFGPFAVQPGTVFRATMTGTGDADLYVRFGTAPTASAYDCRPYAGDSSEECRLTAPSTPTSAYVTVVGYTQATFALTVEFVPGGASQPTAPPGTPQRTTASGQLARGQQQALAPITVRAGSRFVVAMTGTGDPDLYVRFGAAPTLTAFDCRPFQTGAAETCTLTVPAGQTQAFILVNGFSAGSFALTIDAVR